MEIIEPIGVTCMGVVVGFLVRYFVYRYDNFTPKALGATVSVLVGGSIAKFLTNSEDAFWFYPIGLLVGFIVWSVLAILWPNQEGKLFAPVDFVDEENFVKEEEDTEPLEDQEKIQQRESLSLKDLVIIDKTTVDVFFKSDAAVILNSNGVQIMATHSYKWLGEELCDQIASQAIRSIGRNFILTESIHFETQGPDGSYPCSVEVELMGNPHTNGKMMSSDKDGHQVFNNPFYLVGIRLKDSSDRREFSMRITEPLFPIAYYSPKTKQ
ncbi:MAG: hypothetical protein GY797_21090 [Deltaproteobacteria bacterium]|nr:hypothetical protein [Deltaproteobacteria bacterium]